MSTFPDSRPSASPPPPIEPPPLVSDPVRRSASRLGTPSDIVASILGAGTVTLHGFAAAPVMPNWLRPGLHFVSAVITPPELDAGGAARKRRLVLLAGATLFLTHLAAIAISSWLTAEQLRPHSVAAAPEWQVMAVRDAAVVLRLGAAPASPRIEVAVGAALPNGERLQATVPTRGAYMTQTSTIILREQAAP